MVRQGSDTPALTDTERTALAAVCEAFFPGIPESRADSSLVAGWSALSLSVPQRIEETMTVLGAEERDGLRLVLRLLERREVVFGLAGRMRIFSKLSIPQRAKLLRRMSISVIPQLRTAYQGLFRLAAFHQYSTMLEKADSSSGTTTTGNPLWPAIGYTPPAKQPAVKSVLRIDRVQAPTDLECDVCVVGSGAGGSVAAAELAARGRKVIVLEAGSDWQSEEFDQREAIGTRELYLDRGTTTTGDLSVAFLAGAAVGGGTTVNWQSCFRTPAAVLEDWAQRSGCVHFTDKSFGRSLDLVWGRLAVSRVESRVNANNAILERGCAALGYQSSRIARNSLGCDTAQCGYCVYGCRHGGKQTAAVTFLRDAQETGNLTVIARCRADRVAIQNGRVSGVIAMASDARGVERHQVRIAARTVVAACGSLHTPALLMRSGVALPELGRNLFIHPTTAVTGLFADPAEPWNGPPQTVVCDQFADLREGYGYRIETAPAHPGLLAMATPWMGARDHYLAMRRSAHRGVLIVLLRDRSTGRVSLGQGGRPRIHYVPGRDERQLLRHGMASAARILAAAGAERIESLHVAPLIFESTAKTGAKLEGDIESFCSKIARAPVGKNLLQLFSAHQMGTCRMGRDPRYAVCDENGEVFGVRGLYIADASAFPASSGVNPMITIMAMAHHTAGRMIF